MTKKQFIWLVIRFVGIAYLIYAVPAFLTAIGSLVAILMIGWPSFDFSVLSQKITLCVSLSVFLSQFFIVLIAVYLLFAGKLIYRIVNRFSELPPDAGLNNNNYVEILIRFLGVYFLWKIVCRLCLGLYSHFVLTVFEHTPAELNQALLKDKLLFSRYFESIQNQFSWETLFYGVILTVFAYYFLKHGKLIINFFRRRCLSKESQNSKS